MRTYSLNWQKKLKEIYSPPPNDLGWFVFNKIYKKIVFRLKFSPFLYIIPLTFLLVFLLSFIFGYLIVNVVNILQRIY